MGPQYSITVINNSTNSGNICVYQGAPDTNMPDTMASAWLVKYAEPGMTTTFTWDGRQPSPNYFISFSPSTEGNDPQVVEVMFDEAFSATMTLNQQNQWV